MSCDSDFNLEKLPEDLRKEILEIMPDKPTRFDIARCKAYVKAWLEAKDFAGLLKPAVLATPLLDVSSVTIHGAELYARPCEIYGTIFVTNGRCERFDIYHRDRDKPQVVDLNHLDWLSLSGPNAAIEPVTDVTVTVDLKDRARDDAVVAKAEFVLDYTKRDFGEQGVLCFRGSNHSYANMHYVIYPYAVIARVQVSFFFNDDMTGDKDDRPIAVDVYGTLVARICSNLGKDDFPSTILFEKLKNQSVTLTSGTCIQLSRSVVVVPAYASLHIEANLIDPCTDIPIVDRHRTVKFVADDCALETGNVPWKNGFIRVEVKWDSAHSQPCRGREQKRSAEEFSTESKIEEQQVGEMDGSRLEIKEQDKKRRVSVKLLPCDPHPSSAVCGISPLSMEKEKETYQLPMELGEVFSVLIGSKESKSFEIYGSIAIVHCGEEIKIFNRDLDHAETCFLPGRLKSVVGHCPCFFCIDGFYMRLELKDGDRRVARGSFVWTADQLYGPGSWFEKRLCSVFHGDIGYAVVHYSIFQDAVQAEVSVLIGSSDSFDLCDTVVSGQVFASYSKYSYATRYEKKFYRSVLYDEDEPRTCSGQLPLSKGVLPVPRDSDLIVKVKLVVSGENIKRALSFKIDDTHVEEIKGQGHSIKVGIPRWKTLLAWQ